MVEKIKTDADKKIKKSSIVTKYIGTFFFLVKTKHSLSMSILISTGFLVLAPALSYPYRRITGYK